MNTNTKLTLAELEAMPTLSSTQTDDLKYDDPEALRVWLSRCGVAHGEPFENAVTVEERIDDAWVQTARYEAK